MHITPACHEVSYLHGRRPVHLGKHRQKPCPLLCRKGERICAREEHRSAGRLQHALRQGKKRRLAAAIGAEHGRDTTFGNGKGKVLEELALPVAERDVLEREHITHRGTPSPS